MQLRRSLGLVVPPEPDAARSELSERARRGAVRARRAYEVDGRVQGHDEEGVEEEVPQEGEVAIPCTLDLVPFFFLEPSLLT